MIYTGIRREIFREQKTAAVDAGNELDEFACSPFVIGDVGNKELD